MNCMKSKWNNILECKKKLINNNKIKDAIVKDLKDLVLEIVVK